jgi:hypothetical protein
VSANPGLFDHVGDAARRFTVRRVRETGAPLDPAEIRAFLVATAEAYVAEGHTGVDEAMLADVLPRVQRFCLAMQVHAGTRTASNERLFCTVEPQVKAWTVAHRRATHAAVDAVALRAAVRALVDAYRAVPGQAHDDDGHAELVERWVGWYSKMTAVRVEGTRKPGATHRARQEADFEVYMVLAWEREVAEREGRAPRSLSIDDITDALKWSGMKRSQVRGALERLRGRPERQAHIDALTGTARDLVEVLETSGLPKNRLSVLRTDALAEKLWPSTTVAATRRKQRQRLRAAVAEITAAPIDLHVVVLGEVTLVGRGRRLPEGPEEFAAELVRQGKTRQIPAGILARRQGDWGTPEGQQAQSLCRVVASHASDEDIFRVLSQSGLPEAAEDFLRVSQHYGDLCHRDTLGWCSEVEERSEGAFAGIISSPSDQAGAGVERIRALVQRARQDGLGAAWGEYISEATTYACRLSRAEAAPARERIRRIGVALAQAPTPEAWEAVMLLSVASGRPGRRARSLSLPTERRRPGRAAAPKTETKAVTASPQKAEFHPRHYGRTEIPGWLADELVCHWHISSLRPELHALRCAYAGITLEEAAALDTALPFQDSAAAARAGLRTILKTWGGVVSEADAVLEHALHQAVIAVDVALRDRGDEALVYANVVVSRIEQGLGTVERCASLRADLANLADQWAWALAQLDAKAATAA